MPTEASGVVSESPRWTAPISKPMTMAKSAGSTPRSRRTIHHAMARGPLAFGRTLKNIHSGRDLRRAIMARSFLLSARIE